MKRSAVFADDDALHVQLAALDDGPFPQLTAGAGASGSYEVRLLQGTVTCATVAAMDRSQRDSVVDLGRLVRAMLVSLLLSTGCGDDGPNPDISRPTKKPNGSSSGSGTTAATGSESGTSPTCSAWSEWTCTRKPLGNACEATCESYIIDCNNAWGLCNWGIFNGSNIGSCEYAQNSFDFCAGCEHGIKTCQPF